MKKLSLLVACMFSWFFVLSAAFAQVVPPAPAPVVVAPGSAAAPVVVALPPADFLSQVIAAVQGFGGLSTMLKIAAVITLLIASMKVSFLNSLIWSKLGAFQVYVAPALGLIGGILGVGVAGPVTLASVFAYVSAGAGAVFIHEILDSVKAIPGLGAIYVTIIGLVEGALGGPAADAAKAASSPKV